MIIRDNHLICIRKKTLGTANLLLFKCQHITNKPLKQYNGFLKKPCQRALQWLQINQEKNHSKYEIGTVMKHT